MTTELKIATENLYWVFAVYPLKAVIEGCPCCVSNTDKQKIHSRQLRELEEEDLSRYAFKAMTTWGDTDDFKHYLPRIFELMATGNFNIDTSVILGKLEYGNWRDWNENEQNAITDFLLAWWTNAVKNNEEFDKEMLVGIYRLTHSIDQLLNHWKISFDDNSFRNFVDLVYSHYNNLTGKDFKELDPVAIEILLQWIKGNAGLLEQGFFRFSGKDDEFAEKISVAQYIVERA